MIDTTQPRDKIPASVACVFLAALLVGLAFMSAPRKCLFVYERLELFWAGHSGFAITVLLSLAVNLLFLYEFTIKSAGARRQGKNLELLTGKKTKTTSLSAYGLLLGICGGGLAYLAMIVAGFPAASQIPRLSPILRDWSPLVLAVRLSFGLNVLFLALWLSQIAWIKELLKFQMRFLPAFPEPKNGIVLGSIYEDDPTRKPAWVIMTRQALCGNILITGSIGGGKTQGTILPFLDQVLRNFELTPSMLLIDPKGTFIPKAIQILEDNQKKDRILHLKLGGTVTINPLYQARPLKGAKFLEIAQMVKAAAANALGLGGGDSNFWEAEAFNLTKNALIYCYAVKGYCTLEDLYRVMVQANEKDLKADFLHAMETKPFDEEEKFNIHCGLKYFESEYKQLDAKIRTSILATATNFLNQFLEYQANQIFCPKEDRLTLKSMDDVIDSGRILLIDIKNPALAKCMGTFIKLQYEQSILSRMSDESRPKDRSTFLIIDEYQDVVSTGSHGTIGDVGFLAKARESRSVTIVASQSLTSIENAIGKEKAAQELFQNFRTRLSAHSGDLKTIRSFQELAGQENRERTTHSFSENTPRANRNILRGEFEGREINISESISTSEMKEDSVTGKDFSRLRNFECFAMVYDGVETAFHKLFLKPHFLKKKATLHLKLLQWLKESALMLVAALGIGSFPEKAQALPTICSVIKTSEFRSCLDFSVGACTCGWPVPRPCAKISYYVPKTFIEVMPDPKSSYFGGLPGVEGQLATVGKMPYGAESDEDTHSFHAHTLGVPLLMIPFNVLPCGETQIDRFCFDGMSEHLGANWRTGAADLLQPHFLAWSLSPKACLLKGAATSLLGGDSPSFHPGSPVCSYPMEWLPKYPPSSHSACNGWGVFYPRSGVYNGTSQTAGALMIASRMKSLSSEVFQSTASSPDEVWQMITPQSSSCFREGQNVGILETIKNARETGRLSSGKFSGFLFVVWSKVSCCRDMALVPEALVAIEAMKLACLGF